MAEMHFKDKDRIALSVLLGVALHVLLFLLVQLLITAVPEIPKYSGPLFVEITDYAPLQPVQPVQPETGEPVQPETQPDPEPEILPPLSEPEPEPESEPEVAIAVPTAAPKPTVPRPTTPKPTAPKPVTPRSSVTGRTTAEPRPTSRVITPEPTAEVTARPTASPTPTEKSAITGALWENLDKELSSTGSPRPTARTTTPQKTGPARSGAASGGTTPLIEWAVQAEKREVEQQVLPDLTGLSLDDIPESTVKLEFSVQPNGFLTNIVIKESCGFTEADLRVLATLRSWKFSKIPGEQLARATIIFYLKTPG